MVKIVTEVILLAVRRQNVTIDPDIYERFLRIAEKRGIRVSTWITAKMREFVEEEENHLKEKHS